MKKANAIVICSGVGLLVRKAGGGQGWIAENEDYRRQKSSGVPIILNYGVLCHLPCGHKIYMLISQKFVQTRPNLEQIANFGMLECGLFGHLFARGG